MLKLKDVSKFYYSKGVIASGVTKVSLDLELGEFVVITGESGSGKSTILNVISGLDTYEEGEMYINGKETSHYNENDFENYRKTYIGNIFQNFNLVNSYTVYQNIELVLLLNGSKKKDVKNEIIDLIKKVDLYKFRNTKVSKLSGGQKQRVAIARALAKNTPIIIADEPTGNLDTRASKSVIKLLSEVAKEKLVIVVTHNYEQVEEYATRKIKMHDGKIVEDKVLKKHDVLKSNSDLVYSDILVFNKLRLGIRNSFNVIPKFLLTFAVFLFVTVSLLSLYSSFKKNEYEISNNGYNQFFKNVDINRIVIKKQNNSLISDEDYEKIANLNNVDKIIKDDIMLDSSISINDEYFYFYGNVLNISDFKDKLDLGRMPTESNEIIIAGDKDDYYLSEMANDLLNKEFTVVDDYTGITAIKEKVKVVGIKYTNNYLSYYGTSYASFYVSDTVMENLRKNVNQKYSQTETLFLERYFNSDIYTNMNKVIPNNMVPSGSVYVSSNFSYSCKNNNCTGYPMNIKIDNMYYIDEIKLTVSKEYNEKNFKKLLGLDDFDTYNGAFFVNSNDYYSLFNKGNYQSSVFVKDAKMLDETVDDLEKMGYKTLTIKNTIVTESESGVGQIFKIFKLVITVIVSVVLFFVSYFVIRLILKSRNVYYATIRILGASKKVTKQLLNIELLTVNNLVYFIFLLFMYLISRDIIKFKYIKELTSYLKLSDYLIVYLTLTIMSLLITGKYSKKLFKSSAMKTYREEI